MRSTKNDDLVEEVELLNVNPLYANVRRKDGREQNVSLGDLALRPEPQSIITEPPAPEVSEVASDPPATSDEQTRDTGASELRLSQTTDEDADLKVAEPRRSTRSTRGVPPERYGQPVYF